MIKIFDTFIFIAVSAIKNKDFNFLQSIIIKVFTIYLASHNLHSFTVHKAGGLGLVVPGPV